jgi:hypothetical protein
VVSLIFVDWQKTSLVKYMKIMDEFLVGLKPEIEANLKKRTSKLSLRLGPDF